MNPDLICPPYILWPRRVRAGSDPSSPDPRPVIAQFPPSLHEQHPSLPDPVPVVGRCVPVVARFFFNSHTRRRSLWTRRRELSIHCCTLQTRRRAVRTRRCALHTRRRAVRTRRHDPSRTRPAPVHARPISTRAFHYSPALCQSIPACTCHGDCLWDSLKGASYFSSHVIYHN